MEQIAGLFNGPVGSIVGAGLQAVATRISGGSRAPNVCGQVRNEQQKINKFYDNVEAHLQGAMKLLKPAIQIKNMMTNQQGSKSADSHSVKSQEIQISYYTPQKNRSFTDKSCCDCNKNKISKEKYDLSTKKNYVREKKDCKKKLKCETLSEKSNSNVWSSQSKENKRISFKSSTRSSNKLHEISKKNNKISEKSYCSKKCEKCGISILKVKMLSMISCGHVFCHQCISQANLIVCLICKQPLIPSDISTISFN